MNSQLQTKTWTMHGACWVTCDSFDGVARYMGFNAPMPGLGETSQVDVQPDLPVRFKVDGLVLVPTGGAGLFLKCIHAHFPDEVQRSFEDVFVTHPDEPLPFTRLRPLWPGWSDLQTVIWKGRWFPRGTKLSFTIVRHW